MLTALYKRLISFGTDRNAIDCMSCGRHKASRYCEECQKWYCGRCKKLHLCDKFPYAGGTPPIRSRFYIG